MSMTVRVEWTKTPRNRKLVDCLAASVVHSVCLVFLLTVTVNVPSMFMLLLDD